MTGTDGALPRHPQQPTFGNATSLNVCANTAAQVRTDTYVVHTDRERMRLLPIGPDMWVSYEFFGRGAAFGARGAVTSASSSEFK
jgi:hypothetical protein